MGQRPVPTLAEVAEARGKGPWKSPVAKTRGKDP